jgi:hypothetical protein
MARFVDSVPSSWSPEDAFSYMADGRNFAEWDPGTARVAQVRGSGPAPDAAYDVTVNVGSRTTTLRYDVVDWQPPHRVELAASNAVMHLHDEIVIDRIELETLITYDARITLRGPLKVFDRWLDRRFRTMGERAAAGLRARVQRPR